MPTKTTLWHRMQLSLVIFIFSFASHTANADTAATMVDKTIGEIYTSLTTDAIYSAERMMKQTANSLRSSSKYYPERHYIYDAALHLFMANRFLDNSMPQKAGHYYRESVSLLYDGIINHQEAEVINSRQREMWFDIMAAVASAYLQHKGHNTSNFDRAIRETQFEPNFSRIPKIHQSKGIDDRDILRIPVIPHMNFTSAVGRVLNAGGGYCTGARVGRRIVLTNAHCVENGTPTSVVFDEIFKKTEHTVVSHVTHQGVNGFYDDTIKNDWAILVLHPNVPEGMYLGIRGRLTNSMVPRLRGGVMLPGYSSDIGDGNFMTMEWGCSLYNITDGVVDHDCHSWRGSSGGPILTIDGRQIIGLGAVGYRPAAQKDCRGTRDCPGGGPASQQFFREVWELKRRYP
ncbi:trypsin-like serine peptidase [Zobellella sp. An-6]|uniref:trypsin-like serine peptidase n=1 Tax=Zobellella sp. An-6 TaxID=3400218 RepID=UPI00404177E2